MQGPEKSLKSPKVPSPSQGNQHSQQGDRPGLLQPKAPKHHADEVTEMQVVSIDGPSLATHTEAASISPKPKGQKDSISVQPLGKRAGPQKSREPAQKPQPKPAKVPEPAAAGRSASKSRGRASKLAANQRLKETPIELPVKPPKIEASKEYRPDSEPKQVSVIEPEVPTIDREVQRSASEAKKTDQRQKPVPRKKSVAQNPAPPVAQPKDSQPQNAVNTRKRGKSQPMDQNAVISARSGTQKSLEAKQGGKKDIKKAGPSNPPAEANKVKTPRASAKDAPKPAPKQKERATKKKADPRDATDPILHKTKRNASPHSRNKARAERASARQTAIPAQPVVAKEPSAPKKPNGQSEKAGRSRSRKI